MPLAEQRGGSEVMLRQLVEYSDAQAVRWLVIFLEHGPMVAQLQRLGAEVAVVDAGRLREPHRHAAAVARIARLARRHRADVIVGWMVKSQLYAGPAAMLARIPVVWYQLGAPLEPGWLDRVATALPARGILAVSQLQRRRPGADPAAAAAARRAPGDRARPLRPGGAAVAGRRPSATGPAGDGPLIGIVGRLQHWKGIHVLVEAMPRILADHPTAHCVVVGGVHDLEPAYPAFVEARIAALGLEAIDHAGRPAARCRGVDAGDGRRRPRV